MRSTRRSSLAGAMAVLAALLLALACCPGIALADSGDASGYNASGGQLVAVASDLATQSKPGAKPAKTITISPNKAYSRNFSKYTEHSFEFKSAGGKYTLTVNNGIKRTLTVGPYGDKIRTVGLTVTAGSSKKRSNILVSDVPKKGKTTYDLGKLEKGALVRIGISSGGFIEPANQEFTLKVSGKAGARKGKAKIALRGKDATVSVKDAKYTGKPVKPAVTVKYKGKKLKEGTDYKLKYSNNVKVGTAKVKVTGKGKYKGSVTKTFKVQRKGKGKLYLTLISNWNGPKDSGHAFLALYNDTGKSVMIGDYILKNGEKVTLGKRGAGETEWIIGVSGGGGSYINNEAHNDGIYKSFTYITKPISEKKLKRVLKVLWSDTKYDLLTNNCATKAYEAWTEAFPLHSIILRDSAGYLRPKSLKTNIATIPGSKKGTSLKKSGLISKKEYTFDDVFYMAPGKLCAGCPTAKLVKPVSCSSGPNSITLSWDESAVLENVGKNPHTGKSYANGYVVRYRKDGSAAWSNVQLRTGFGTGSARREIGGLEAGTSYEIVVSPAYFFTVDKRVWCYYRDDYVSRQYVNTAAN